MRSARNPATLREYRQVIADAGLSISALSCHSNPLHPDRSRQGRRRGVPADRVPGGAAWKCPSSSRSRDVPGDAEGAAHPNWITTPWPPEFHDVLEWQWDQKAIPVLDRCRPFASNHGVKVALGAASRIPRLQRRDRAAASRRDRSRRRRQFRSESFVLAGRRHSVSDSRRSDPRSFTCMPRT